MAATVDDDRLSAESRPVATEKARNEFSRAEEKNSRLSFGRESFLSLLFGSKTRSKTNVHLIFNSVRREINNELKKHPKIHFTLRFVSSRISSNQTKKTFAEQVRGSGRRSRRQIHRKSFSREIFAEFRRNSPIENCSALFSRPISDDQCR